ncbi:hypothetical protein [Salinisphaera orenii]|uniref:hypothetical protein n=1 Tax=Salinisphaera orenii TaxID=856731 RepID=UPI000DBE6C32
MAKQQGNRRADIPTQFERGFLDQMDSRSNLAKNLRNRYDQICADLGGQSELSYMQCSLIERALWLETWLGRQEAELANGGDFDVSRWIQAANSLQGIFSRLGLERRARQTPDLQTYLQGKAAQ